MENKVLNAYFEKFMFAGNAHFTLVSTKTNKHYTYHIAKKKGENVWFVKILDHHAHEYVGYIRKVNNEYKYAKGNKGKYDMNDNRVISLMWFIRHMNDADINDKVVMYHAGRCCKCGRVLTDPKSIELGIGPECAKLAY